MEYLIRLLSIIVGFFIIMLYFGHNAKADDLALIVANSNFKLIELNEAKFTYDHFLYGRDPNFFLGPPKDRISLNIDTSILRHFEWNSQIHGTSDNSQYRWIGLQTEFLLNITDTIQFGFHHHSQHLLDSQYPYGKFPDEDTWRLNIFLFQKNKHDGLF